MRQWMLVLGFGGVIACVQPLSAQLVEVDPRPGRFAGGVGLSMGVPVGEFQDFIDFGGGFGGYLVTHFDDARTIGLRADVGFIIYGSETVRRPFSDTIRRVTVDVTTTNSFFALGVGPQWTPATGRVRPYVYGTVGLSYFFTESSVRGDADFTPFVSSTNFDDVTFALAGGGGLVVRLTGGNRPISLDFASEFLRHGETRYLREGGIQERPDGSIFVTPIESNTNMVLFRIGIAIGFHSAPR